ncbi:MAG: HAD family hydrolase, partial [Ruminococcus sp.]|nr:HAD family hydrolase [Ruminococcus sp.]
DMKSGKYIKNSYIQKNISQKIISVFRENDVNCFMFKFVDNILSTFYDKVTDELMQSYVAERKGKFAQPFFECNNLVNEIDGSEIYINSTGDYESLLPIRNAVAEIEGADCAFYKDTYTDKWFLETFSNEASKANGLKFLREEYGFEHIMAFGDNLNDLSMFEQADFRIAVGNAHPDVKDIADLIVDTNDNDGVAKELKDKFLFNMIGGIF